MTPAHALKRVQIIDDVLGDPARYRAEALACAFRSYDFGHCVFHGIATPVPSPELLDRIRERFPHLKPVVTFFRKSPEGQVEPHFIHTDVDMGEWSAILYLNPAPPPEDGTCLWTHRESGAIESAIAHERSIEGRDPARWELRHRAPARFNRLLMFPSTYFHSRAIHENWGAGAEARLTQVVFGEGTL